MSAEVFDDSFFVGSFRIDRLKGTISCEDATHHVPPKAMEVLVCLARNAGELVSRDEIEKAVWGPTRVSGGGVTRAISALRHAFDDHREEPRYIQTLPKRGYRLVAKVVHRDPETTSPEVENGNDTPETGSLWEELKRRKVIRVAIAYAGVAWLLIQFADTVFPFVGIPYSTTSLVVALVILGFPVAVVAAWMIEKTNRGLFLDKGWVDGRKTRMLRRRNLNILIIALSIIAITVATNIMFRGEVAYTFEARDWVVIAEFENLTDDELLDESLGRAFRVRMSQSPYVNLLPENVVRESLLRMTHDETAAIDRQRAREIAIREDARAVIATSIAKVGNRFNLTADIIDPASNATVMSHAATADSRDDILEALEILADAIRTDLGESMPPAMSSIAAEPLEKVTTSNLEALNAYSIAMRRQNEGDYESAVDLLQRAIELDPEFASAYALLGTVLSQMGRPPTEFEPFWQKAIESGDRLPTRERLHIEGILSWLDTPAKMERAWTLVTNYYPDDAQAHHDLGRVYLQFMNDGEQALYSFERAAVLPKAERAVTLIYLGYAQLFNNRPEEALASFQSALAIDNNPRNFALADGYIVLKQYDAAKRFLDEYTRASTPVFGLFKQIRFHMYHLDRGEMQRALESLGDAERVFRSIYDRHSPELGLLALSIYEFLGDPLEVDSWLQGELNGIDNMLNSASSLSEQGQNINLILQVGAIAARNGRIEQAQEIRDADAILVEIRGFPVRTAFHTLLGAEIALANGNAYRAISLLEESLTRVEVFAVREALARAYRAAGNPGQAMVHYEWIRANRGRAFSEWHEDNSDRGLNVLNWSLAAYHLATLYDERGEAAAAAAHYDEFIEHWALADSTIPQLIDARERRAALP